MTDKEYKPNFTEKQFNEIFGRTGKKIDLKDWLTGEDKVYFVHKSDSFVSEKCPIDGSHLNYIEVAQRWAGYICINCENTFEDISPEGLNAAYENILDAKKKKLSELEGERSNLVKIISRLEKK